MSKVTEIRFEVTLKDVNGKKVDKISDVVYEMNNMNYPFRVFVCADGRRYELPRHFTFIFSKEYNLFLSKLIEDNKKKKEIKEQSKLEDKKE